MNNSLTSVNRASMWKTLAQSVQGTAHRQSGQACQDCCAARQIDLATETVLILVCSDGADSAALSQIGARLACDTIADVVTGELQRTRKLPVILLDRVMNWLRQVHKVLDTEAEWRHVDAQQLACTLLLAVVGQSGAAFGQVGEGAIVVWQDGQYRNVFWPPSDQQLVTHQLVTDPQFESFLAFTWRETPVDEVALLTGGLRELGADFRDPQAGEPFFGPLLQLLRKQAQPEALLGALCELLESPAVVERTDQDKTAILATRVAV
jgi:hypothetical protein